MLENIPVRLQLEEYEPRPRPCVGSWVRDCNVVFQGVMIDAPHALYNVQGALAPVIFPGHTVFADKMPG